MLELVFVDKDIIAGSFDLNFGLWGRIGCVFTVLFNDNDLRSAFNLVYFDCSFVAYGFKVS
jgi:hypothetical protein